MPKRTNTRNHGPASKYPTPKLDEDEYHLLFDTVLENVFLSNKSAMSRVLGVNRKTLNNMEIDAPRQWWWNAVLKDVLKHYYQELNTSAHKKHRDQAQSVMRKLNRARHNLFEELEIFDANNGGAARYLLAALCDSSTGMISLNEARKPGFAGAYKPRTLRRAAERLGLVKEYREDEWYWRLPTSDDVGEE